MQRVASRPTRTTITDRTTALMAAAKRAAIKKARRRPRWRSSKLDDILVEG